MSNTIGNEMLRSEVKKLISGINAYFVDNYNIWEKETRRWVTWKAEDLFPSGNRERFVDEINEHTPHSLLQQLSDEWPVEPGVVESLIADIKARYGVIKEQQGNETALEIVNESIKWLKAKAAQLVHVEFAMSLSTLNWLYEDAKEVTIIEFFTRSNYKDVIEYHEELRKKLWEIHYEAVEWHEAKILSEVAMAMENMTK